MNLILIIIVALLFPGIINITRSWFSGRKGPGLLQPVKDLIRLFRKGSVYSQYHGYHLPHSAHHFHCGGYLCFGGFAYWTMESNDILQRRFCFLYLYAGIGTLYVHHLCHGYRKQF